MFHKLDFKRIKELREPKLGFWDRIFSRKVTIQIESDTEKLFFEIYKSLVEKLIATVKYETGLSRDMLIRRPLLPQDIGLKDPIYSFKLKTGKNRLIDGNIADNRLICIWGIHIPKGEPLTQLEIIKNMAVIRKWHIQNLSGDYFVNDPFTVSQNMHLIIEGYNPSRKRISKITFYGTVVERKGMTIIV